MFEEGLSYPLRGDSALGRIVVGGLLSLASVLVVPGILVLGYLVRVLDSAARTEREPPAFEDWAGLLADGLQAIVITVVYGVLPVALVGFSVLVLGAGGAAESSLGGVVAGLGFLGFLVSLVALVFLYYLVPAALANFAIEDSMAAAFDAGMLKRTLLSVDYFIAWLIPFVLAFFVNLVTGVLAFTIIGLVFVPFIQFYTNVAVFYMFGRAVGKVNDVATVASDPSETAG
jgi:hypothetical protein